MLFLLSLAAVLAVSAFLIRRCSVPSSAAPFISIVSIVSLMCAGAMLDLLRETGYVVFAAALLLGVFAFACKNPPRETLDAQSFFSPGMVFFLAASLFFFTVFTLRDFYFRQWDEFSFWGTAAKALFTENRLYTLSLASVVKNDYPPAMPVLSYFFQFWCASFREGYVYCAYDVLLASVAAAAFGNARFKEIPRILLTGGAGFLMLYLYSAEEAYHSAYADIPLGAVLAGALICWYSARGKAALRLGALPALFLLPFMKNAGLGLALIGLIAMLADSLFAGESRRLGRESLAPLLFAAAPLASHLLWRAHVAASPVEAAVSESYQYGFFDIINGKDPFFADVIRRMWAQTLNDGRFFVSMSLLAAVLLLAALPLLSALFARGLRRKRLAVYGLCVLALTVIYFFSMAYAYTSDFSRIETEGELLPSMFRYFYNIVTVWLYCSLFLLTEPGAPEEPLRGRPLLGFGACLAVCAFVLFNTKEPYSLRALTSPALEISLDETRTTIKQLYGRNAHFLKADDSVYFEAAYTSDIEWLEFTLEAMPVRAVTPYGHGHLVPLDTPNPIYPDTPCDLETLVNYLLEQNCGYMLVFRCDDYYISEFGPLYADGLAGALDKSVCLYKIIREGEHGLTMIPIVNAYAVESLREQYGY
ncbi:MAG: hypothetical protein Q4B42_03560 [Oscillospiraceae bacterium]|nr:hypothetical protein [Oscillospiraceae bacterium]